MTEPGPTIVDQLADVLASARPRDDWASMLAPDEVGNVADDLSEFMLGILGD
jgi:hypothetical protein